MAGKRSRPTAAILDIQSVRSNCHGGDVGYVSGKKIKGRKRHILVDTLGMMLGVFITPASTQEREDAQGLLDRILDKLPWLRLIWADGGYSGEAFANWVRIRKPCLDVEVVKCKESAKGFNILKRRWIVERTFG
ncbi:IS5/IS1182 family transposase [Verrucomicrobia bacterium]|nr:IS5/IS1182 family transposase [Verrucomicrobiota bacterium]